MTTDSAIPQLMELAAAGDAEAQLELGKRYLCGEGVEEDPDAAFRLLRLAADQGIPEAQSTCGDLLFFGICSAPDYQQGHALWRKAARGGYAGAAWKLGSTYRDGSGCRKSPWRARIWFERALALGEVRAHREIAGILLGREPDRESVALAIDHLRRGARQGHLQAAADLGDAATDGYGSMEDLAESERILVAMHAKAKRQPERWPAEERRGILEQLFRLRRRSAVHPPRPPQIDEVEAELARRKAMSPSTALDFTPEDVSELKFTEEQLRQLERAAENGSAAACGFLARHLARSLRRDGHEDVERVITLARLAAAGDRETWAWLVGKLLVARRQPGDYEEAAWWLRDVAERNPRAASAFGSMLSRGRGVRHDLEAAIAFWQLGAREDPAAAARAGESLIYGLCVPVDEQIGLEMLHDAFNDGDADAANILGTCYDEGAGVPQNGMLAECFFRTAADKGLSAAALNLGILLFDGRRRDPDPVEAARWLEQAAGGGWPQAQHLLAVMTYRGEGVPRNVEKARRLFEQAQENGHLPSLFTTLEDEVLRVRPAAVRQRDFAGMIRLAEEAAARGDGEAAFLAALAHWYGEADIPQDEDKGLSFFQIAAERGHLVAKACLSEVLRHYGEIDEADEWLREAAEGGLKEAESRLEALGYS